MCLFDVLDGGVGLVFRPCEYVDPGILGVESPGDLLSKAGIRTRYDVDLGEALGCCSCGYFMIGSLTFPARPGRLSSVNDGFGGKNCVSTRMVTRTKVLF